MRATANRGDSWVGNWIMAEIATLADDHEDASRRLTIVCEWLEASGQLGFLSTYAPMLGRELCALDRYDEAAETARLGRQSSRSTTSAHRRSGGRYRRASTRAAASTPRLSPSPARQSRCSERRTHYPRKATRSPTWPRSSIPPADATKPPPLTRSPRALRAQADRPARPPHPRTTRDALEQQSRVSAARGVSPPPIF